MTKLDADGDLPPLAFTRMSRPMLWRVFAGIYGVFPFGLVFFYFAPMTRHTMPELTVGWAFGWLAILAGIAIFLIGLLVWLFQEIRVSRNSDQIVAWQGLVRKTIRYSEIQRVELIIDQRSKMDGLWLRIIGHDRYFEFNGPGDGNVGPVLTDLAEILGFEWIGAEREASERINGDNYSDWRAILFAASGNRSLIDSPRPKLGQNARRHDARFEAALSVMLILPMIASVLVWLFLLAAVLSEFALDSIWLLMASLVPAAAQSYLFHHSLERRGQRSGPIFQLGFGLFWAASAACVSTMLVQQSALITTITAITGGILAYAYVALTRALIAWFGRRSRSLWSVYQQDLAAKADQTDST